MIPPLYWAASNSTVSTLRVVDKQCGNIQAFLKSKKNIVTVSISARGSTTFFFTSFEYFLVSTRRISFYLNDLENYCSPSRILRIANELLNSFFNKKIKKMTDLGSIFSRQSI